MFILIETFRNNKPFRMLDGDYNYVCQMFEEVTDEPYEGYPVRIGEYEYDIVEA